MEILLCGNTSMPMPPHGRLGGSTSQGLLVYEFESATNHPTARILRSGISHSHELDLRLKGCRVSITRRKYITNVTPCEAWWRGTRSPCFFRDQHAAIGADRPILRHLTRQDSVTTSSLPGPHGTQPPWTRPFAVISQPSSCGDFQSEQSYIRRSFSNSCPMNCPHSSKSCLR